MTGALSPTALANAAHSIGPGLLAAALAVPLVMLTACLSQGLRRHMLALQWLAPLPALAAALLSIGGVPLAFEQPALRVSLLLDTPGAMLLAVAALLWIAISATAFAETRGRAFCGLLAAHADRQSRGFHRRRSPDILSCLRARQHPSLWVDRA